MFLVILVTKFRKDRSRNTTNDMQCDHNNLEFEVAKNVKPGVRDEE